MLSLYKLEIFAAVIQEGSFSAAAKRLPMTQPAVSQHVQDLETSLGTQLFNRNRRGAVLTPAGEVLYEYTRVILRLVGEAETAVTNVDNLSGGQTFLMATPGISVYLLPEWIGTFRLRYPNLGIVLNTGVTTDVIAQVHTNAVDLGFVEGEMDTITPPNMGRISLRDIDMVLTVVPSHPWAQLTEISMAQLHEQPFITRQPFSRTRIWLDKLFHQAEIKPRIVGEFDNPEAIKQAVMSGVGVAFLPDYAIRNERRLGLLKVVVVNDALLTRHMTLLYDNTRTFTPIARALLTHLTDIFPAIKSVL